MKRIKQKKNDNKIFPFLLLGSVVLIIAVMLTTLNTKDKKENEPNVSIKNESKDNLPIREVTLTGVIKTIEEAAKNITVTSIEDGQDYLMEYTGGTNFMNKYGKISVISSMPVGEIVEATYNKDNGKLTQVKISNEAFDYQGISNWRRDTMNNGFIIAESKYKCADYLTVTSKGQVLDIDDLDETDEITIKGFDREIYSVIVTKGHGTLRFTGYDDFIGGIAYIGTKYIIPVIEDMIITVREGNYEISLEIGDFKGTVPILAVEGEEILVDMSEFKKPVIETGLVNFLITPEGADLYIDNIEADYDKDISLEYGEHNILVSLGGYTAYTGIIDLAEAEKTVIIQLVEANTETDSEEEDGDDEEESNNPEDTDSDDNSTDGEYEEVNAKNYIHIEAPEGASVYFNGEFKGTAPVSFPKQAGTGYITLIKSGYTTKTYTVEIKDDEKDVKLNFAEMVIQE